MRLGIERLLRVEGGEHEMGVVEDGNCVENFYVHERLDGHC